MTCSRYCPHFKMPGESVAGLALAVAAATKNPLVVEWHVVESREVVTPERARRRLEIGTDATKRGTEAALSFLSFGGPCWTRTNDSLLKRQVLYHLS